MLFIRSLIFNCWFFFWTTMMTLLAFFWGMFGYYNTVRVAIIWGRGMMFMAKHVLNLTTEIRGLENVPKDQPYIFACKHQSAYDTTLIQILAPRTAVIMKKELLNIPVFGQVLLFSKAILLDRSKGKRVIPQLIEGAKERVAQGRGVFMYPEGTRTQAGVRGPYKQGIFALYEALNIPVIPAALNTGYFWPRRGFIKYPGHVVVEVLPAIAPGLNQEAFMETLENTIETACDKLPKRIME